MQLTAQLKHRRIGFCVVLLCFIFILLASPARSQGAEPPDLPDKESTSKPYLGALQYYWDSRDYNTFGITVASDLPLDFNFWGFTDLHSSQGDSHSRYNMARSFSEYRLSYKGLGEHVGLSGLGLQLEYNDSTPGGNEILRFGPTFKHALTFPKLGELGGTPGWLQWRVQPIESDGDGGQVSVIYNIPLHKRVSITGFADLNYDDHRTFRWVVEPQLNIILDDRFLVVAEFRYNEFERKANGVQGLGFAFGFKLNI